ncbi:MAG: hypothetical protein JWP68_1644 [Modestobacter sp.]|nr:hypothetical protein [Modestobacter sp.]
MGGRRDDSAPGRTTLPPVPPRAAAGPSPARSAERAVAARVIEEAPSSGRRGWLVVGLVLAVCATAAVFFTDNPLYLRVALLAVCWAFVVAAFLAGNRRTDQVVAASREAELRHAYDLELEREVAARYEYEVELESRLRQEAEDAMREELAQLRTELAGLSTLQDDLAAISRLRDDLAGLGQLRTELAALTEMRGELAGLGQIRAELAGLAELRSDLGRMRTELTEQLSGELLIERMVMRAQSVRGPAQPGPDLADGRILDGTPSWGSSPAGGWDVDRWQETRVVPAEPVEPAPRLIAGPPPVPPPLTRTLARVDEETTAGPRPPSPIEWLVEESVLEPWVESRPRSPLEWLGDQALLDANGQPTGGIPVASQPGPTPRRHRRAAEPDDEDVTIVPSWSPEPVSSVAGWSSAAEETPAAESDSYDSSGYDEMLFGTSTYRSPSSEETPSYGASSYETPSYETPSWSTGDTSWSARSTASEIDSSDTGSPDDVDPRSGSTSYRSTGYDASGYAAPGRTDAPAQRDEPEPQGHARLAQILAESGVEAPSGGRSRRRRHRDEAGETPEDDVLARVLGRN